MQSTFKMENKLKQGGKMKKIYSILLIIFLVGIVSAYTIGQIITQQQLDNLNVDNIHFDIDVKEIQIKSGSVFAYFNYTTLVEFEDEYKVVSKDRHVACPMNVYTKCRLEGDTKQTCIGEMKSCLKTKVIRLRELERNRIENWQNIENELSVNDLDLGDLN